MTRRLVSVVLVACLLAAGGGGALADELGRYELPEHRFAVTVPQPPAGSDILWFTSRLVPGSDQRGLEQQIDDLAQSLPMDRQIVANLLEAGEQEGAVLMGASWSGVAASEFGSPFEVWWIVVVPWTDATAEEIGAAWVDGWPEGSDGQKVGIVEVPSGEAVYIHDDAVSDGIGGLWSPSSYYLTDGSMVLALQAASTSPPEDRWLSFLSTVEIWPEPE